MSDLTPTSTQSPQPPADALHSAIADNESFTAMNAHPYPDGFHDLPIEERNQYFAKETARLAKRQTTAEVVRLDPRATKQQANPFKLVDWNDIEFDPNEEWRVEDVLPMRGFGLLYRKPRSFKSFVALDVMIHVALALPWAGKRVEQGRVVYVVAEGQRGMRKRIAALKAKYNVARDIFAVIEGAPNLGAAEGDLLALIAAVEGSGIKQPAVIVVDTTAKAIGAAEENGAGMAAFVLNADKLAQHFDCLVLGLHHVGLGEDAQKRPRGHSSLGGALDVQILCERPGDERRTSLTIQKLKDEADGVCLEAHLSRVVVGADKYGKEISTLVVDEVVEADVQAAKRPSKAVPRLQRLLMDVVALALDEKGEEIRPFGMNGPRVRGVADSHIRDRYFARVAEKAAPDEDEGRLYDRQLKAFNRSIKGAVDARTLVAGDHKGERFIWQP